MRDVLMHRLMRVSQYPEIHFTLDSLTDLTRQGDTLGGMAFGILELNGVKKPVSAAVKAFRDGGGMRVLGKFHFEAPVLFNEFHYSKYSMQLAVGTGIWHDLFMGVDLVLRPADTAASSKGGSN